MRLPVLRRRCALLHGFIGLGIVLSLACDRRLVIRQDAYVNNGMHNKRPEGRRTGEPLEVSVVLVLPDDYSKDANRALREGEPVTSATWYERRPSSGRGDRFDIPEKQVFTYTLHGEALEGQREIQLDENRLKELLKDNPWDWKGPPARQDTCVIFVFPKFLDQEGRVLPTRPLRFKAPGKLENDVEIRVGVNKELYNANNNWGQYIESRDIVPRSR